MIDLNPINPMAKTFFCKVCRKRIPTYLKKTHLKGHTKTGICENMMPQVDENVIKMFLKKYYKKEPVVCFQTSQSLFKMHNQLRKDVCYRYDSTSQSNEPTLLIGKPVPFTKNPTKFMQECFQGYWQRHYARFGGPSLFDPKLFPELTKNQQHGLWIGGRSTKFGIHRDGDHLALNYLHRGGPKVWWIVKKSKEKIFRNIILRLLEPEIRNVFHIL